MTEEAYEYEETFLGDFCVTGATLEGKM